MEEFNFYNAHYIRTREDGCIIDGFSDALHQPQEGDICINEQGGYQFRLFPDGEENPSLFDFDYMIPLYKWDGEAVVRRTDAEMEAERGALPEAEEQPTQLDRVEAQVTYTAMMTDTLLEV